MASDVQITRFLRKWRGRRDPNQVAGFVARFGERTKLGLLQAEMGPLTGVTAGWYQKLEAGRVDKPSKQWLENIVRVLELNEAERMTLYLYTRGEDPPMIWRPTAAVDPSTAALIRVQPWAAYLSDWCWDVLLYNEACEHDWPWMRHGVNIMIWALTYPEARLQLIDWEETWAKPMASQLRLRARQDPGNQRLAQVIAEIRERDRVAARLLDDDLTSVAHPDGHRRWLYLPGHGNEEFEVVFRAYKPHSDETQRLMFVVPVDHAMAA
ncbi:helix-turn-helix domain-containing protein [Streptomyces sp. NPDC050636]|uniref:MmyB family transcriptional regulator n=1 Tax=Streptomyces sp. NPDC050636 TaxID=3154510 RepID=UPI003427CF19